MTTETYNNVDELPDLGGGGKPKQPKSVDELPDLNVSKKKETPLPQAPLYGMGGKFLPDGQKVSTSPSTSKDGQSKSIEDRVRDYVYSQRTPQEIEENKRQNVINAEIVAIPPKTKAEKLPTENAPIGKAALLGLTSVVSGTLKSIGIAAKRLDFFNEYSDKRAEDLATYKAGQWVDEQIRDLVGDLTPEQKEIFAVKLWQGVGNMGGFLFGGIGSKILKASPVLTTAGLGAATQASAEYEAAIQSGATPEEAAKVFWINGAIGTTEVLPIMGALRKLDKYSGGVATGALAKKLASTAAGRITNEMVQGFIREGTQEATQQILTNTVAANTYDTTRRIFDGVLESGAIGGIIGSTMTGVVSSIREKREAGNLTKEEEIQLAAAEEFAEKKIAEVSDPIKNEVTTSTPENPKVKSILKAKTDIEADLASNPSLTDETRASIQSEVETLGQELDAAKSEVYQQELNGKIATNLKEQIESDKALLEDKTLSDASKSIIQKNIATNQERLEPIKQFIPTEPKTHVPPKETENEDLITQASEAALTDIKEKNIAKLFSENPEEGLKEAAQQLNATKGEAETARKFYGDTISDIALKLFPNEKVESPTWQPTEVKPETPRQKIQKQKEQLRGELGESYDKPVTRKEIENGVWVEKSKRAAGNEIIRIRKKNEVLNELLNCITKK